MTKDEKTAIFNAINSAHVNPDDSMTLVELKAYVKGFEDALNSMEDAVSMTYGLMKTD